MRRPVIALILLAAMFLAAATACPTTSRRPLEAAFLSGADTSSLPRPRSLAADTLGASSFALPAPVGHVNDHAGVLPDSTKRSLEEKLRRIRASTDGEIVLVTFADLGTFAVEDIARRLGNEWGVGASSGRARGTGTVVLVVPKETSGDRRGHCRIELADGASSFITDSAAAGMCAAAIPSFRKLDYGSGLRVIVDELERRYDAMFPPER
jgi:uncharacterized membrane protein YgcG